MTKKFRQLSIIKQTSLLILIVTLFGSVAMTAVTTLYTSHILMKDSERVLQEKVESVVRTLKFFDQTQLSHVDRLDSIFQSIFPGEFRLNERLKLKINNIESPVISYDNKIINKSFDAVDKFTRVTGAVAAIFVKHQNDFLRISTSLSKEDGTRAMGSYLGKTHPGYESLISGGTYKGYTKLFNRDYIAKYAPIKSLTGDVIGLVFFGVDITDDIDILKEELSNIRMGETGYIYIVNDSNGPERGKLILHPTLQGENLTQTADAAGEFPFARLLEGDKGLLEYSWFVEGVDTKSKDKLVAYEKFPNWQWIIAGGANVEELTHVSTKLRNLFIVLSTLGCVIFTILIYKLLQVKFAPVNEIKNKLEIASGGDLTQSVKIPGEDLNIHTLVSDNEIVGVAAHFNHMITGFKELVMNLSQSTHNVIGSANSLHMVSQQNTEGMIKQQSDADQLAHAMVKMAEMSKDVIENAITTAEKSTEADQLAAEGIEVMDQTMMTINDLAHEIGRTSEVVSVVQTQSNSISEAVNTIRGIAEQTNLLALNAAIEAARAGEQGRGFAVVADEVRTLATRSRESTDDIQRIIGELLVDTGKAVETMKQGQLKSEECVSVAMEAKEKLDSITETVSQIATMNSQIVSAAEQQYSVTEEIKLNIESIRKVTAEGINSSQSITCSAQELNNLSTQLLEDISQFKVRDEADDEVELF